MGFRICCQTMTDALYDNSYPGYSLTKPEGRDAYIVTIGSDSTDTCPFCGSIVVEVVVN